VDCRLKFETLTLEQSSAKFARDGAGGHQGPAGPEVCGLSFARPSVRIPKLNAADHTAALPSMKAGPRLLVDNPVHLASAQIPFVDDLCCEREQCIVVSFEERDSLVEFALQKGFNQEII
jgi:hypothetical protein